jgi:hypothetical protein
MTTGAVSASRSKNVRQAANSSSDPIPASTPSRASRAGSIQPASAGSDVGRHARGDPLARRRLVVVLGQARPAADHLAQGPERDPVAVCRAPPRVPPDVLGQAVEVLDELPGEPGLADPGRADHRYQAGPALPPRRREQVLERAELLVPPDEGRLEGVAPVPPAAPGDDADGAPGGDRRRLPRERLRARLLEGDRSRRGPLRRLAHEHAARGRDRL